MKKSKILLVVLLCTFFNIAFAQEIDLFSIDDFVESPFSNNMKLSDQDIENTFGKATRIENLTNEPGKLKGPVEKILNYYYDGLKISIMWNGEKVERNIYFVFQITNKNTKLRNGLSVGSTVAEVKKLLGNSYSTFNNQIVYTNKKVWYSLSFIFDRNVVTKIIWNREL